MKYADIQKIHEAGLTTDQRQKILEHFQLKEDSNKFLAIISFVGAVLVASGIALLIAANWDTIPRAVKLAVGLGLMLGAHGFGWWLPMGVLLGTDVLLNVSYYHESVFTPHMAVKTLSFLGISAIHSQAIHG
jgi:uncharacterized membrane protein